MSKIILSGVTKSWGRFCAVDNLDLIIDDNAFVTLLGPSGCGKTTVLRMIAGLETPTEGRITIGDQIVFDDKLGINVPANKRKVGFLFQNYALWPNMTVYENIAFGLRNIRELMPKVDIEAKNAARLSEILRNPGKVREILEECLDANGKIDERKASISLIDAYSISSFTAKKLLGYHLEHGNDVSVEASYFQGKADAAHKRQEEAGLCLNDQFEVVKDGEVVMEVRKLTKEEIDLKVRQVSRTVKISMYMDRYPSELSGGQQQRVAIARTLAPEPDVLFMDEPLSNLDAKLRLEMRYELQRLHVETGSTFVYVTHDQMEAMTLATKIFLMNNGVLQQYAAPMESYNAPSNLFAADFVGNPSINFIEAKRLELMHECSEPIAQNIEGIMQLDSVLTLEIFNGRKVKFRPKESFDFAAWFMKRDYEEKAHAEKLKTGSSEKGFAEKSNKDESFRYHISKVDDDYSPQQEQVITNDDFVLGIRPEHIVVGKAGVLDGEIYGSMPTGMEVTYKVGIDGYLLTGVVFGSTMLTIGDHEQISFSGENIMLFDRKSGKRICVGALE